MNILTKFHEDWIKTALSSVQMVLLTFDLTTYFLSKLTFFLNSGLDFIKISILTKFHKTGSKLCPLESPHGFPKNWPNDLAFDPTWPIFNSGLDFIKMNILTKRFMKIGSILCPLLCTTDFTKIWPNDLVFDPTWPFFKFWPRFYLDKHSDKVSWKLEQNCAL